jgi:cell division protein FtsB
VALAIIHFMSYIEKPKLKKKNIYNKFTAILLSIITLILGASVVSVFEKYQDSGNKVNISKSQYEVLKQREQYLKLEMEKLSTLEGKEEAIRNKYRAVKEGEEVIVIIDQNKSRINLDDNSLNKKTNFLDIIKSWFN